MPAPMSSEPRAGGPRPTTTRALPTRWTGSSCATTEHAVRRSRARRAPLSLLAPNRHRSILAPLRACSMPLGRTYVILVVVAGVLAWGDAVSRPLAAGVLLATSGGGGWGGRGVRRRAAGLAWAR